MNASEPLLPRSEDEEHEEAKNDHGDEGSGTVWSAAVGLEGEGQEEEAEGGHEDESARNCEDISMKENKC